MPKLIAVIAAAILLVVVGVHSTSASAQTVTWFILSGENNRLNVYSPDGKKATVIPSAADNPATGLDINAEICIVPEGVPWKPVGEVWFIAGEDTDQNTQPGVIRQGWGIFRLMGTTLTTFSAVEVGKLVPDSFVTQQDNPENFGCGVLPDGRIVTTDVGDQLPQSPATGQLIEWFPQAWMLKGHLPSGRTDFRRVPHCKIDVALGTAGGIEVDGTTVYVATNRPDTRAGRPGGIYRYNSATWPSWESPAAGCGREDASGEQLANANRVGKSLFIAQSPVLLTPSDIVDSGRGTFFVSSVFSGVIAEFTKTGVFKRYVMVTTGQAGGVTPFGIGVTPAGNLWVADLGIRGPLPFPGAGKVVKVAFDENDKPRAPYVIDRNLEFPDGIGVVVFRG